MINDLTVSGTSHITFGIDDDGNYGYKKVGADTVTPFKSGEYGSEYLRYNEDEGYIQALTTDGEWQNIYATNVIPIIGWDGILFDGTNVYKEFTGLVSGDGSVMSYSGYKFSLSTSATTGSGSWTTRDWYRNASSNSTLSGKVYTAGRNYMSFLMSTSVSYNSNGSYFECNQQYITTTVTVYDASDTSKYVTGSFTNSGNVIVDISSLNTTYVKFNIKVNEHCYFRYYNPWASDSRTSYWYGTATLQQIKVYN